MSIGHLLAQNSLKYESRMIRASTAPCRGVITSFIIIFFSEIASLQVLPVSLSQKGLTSWCMILLLDEEAGMCLMRSS